MKIHEYQARQILKNFDVPVPVAEVASSPEEARKIAEEISTLKEEQIETRRKKKLADNYEQRLRDMDSFLQSQTCQIPEFDNDLVRRLIANIKVVSADKLIIQFQSGIVMEQEISYD